MDMPASPAEPRSSPTFSRGAKIAGITAMTLLSLVTFTLFSGLLLARKHSIASSAMNPTLYSDEHVMAAPVMLTGAPKAGDVSTFWVGQGDRRFLYVMRVIGTPGDRVSLQNGRVSINGNVLQRKDLGQVQLDEAAGIKPRLYEETLPSGYSYVVLDDPDSGGLDDMDEITVPADHYFVLGDNRDNSNDSRSPNVGAIARQDFAGKVLLIHFSFDTTGFRFDRIGTWVR
jgi:signal peptidase I